MKVMVSGAIVEVVLSKRNLLSLLHKVDDDESARTLTRRDGDRFLIVMAEPDETHYDRPEGGPGAMHPATEAFIRENA